MSMLLHIVLASALAVAPLVSHGEDLLEVYAQARRADPVLSRVDADRLAAHEGVEQARAPLLPQVSAGLSFQQLNVPSSTASNVLSGANRSRDAQLNLNQVVVDVGKLSRLGLAKTQANAQDAVYRAAEQGLMVRVASAYFNVLTAADQLLNVQSNEDAYRQQVEQANQRYANGLSALVDVEQARSYYSAARASTISASTTLDDAREALSEITGTRLGALRALRENLPMAAPDPADPQVWLDTALAGNPALFAQKLALTAADQSVDVAHSGHLPTISAGVSLGRGNSWPVSTSDTDGRTVTTVGITLNVPLFAGGATQSLVRQALHQRDSAADTLEQQRRAVARTTLNEYRSVVAGIGKIEATRTSVEAARKALASTRVGQQLGTHTMTDLLLAIQSLTSAQSSYSAVRHQFIVDKLLLLQAAGTIGEADLATANALLQ